MTHPLNPSDDPGFGPAHLPYGVFAPADGPPRVGVRIAGHVLDLSAALGDPEFAAASLNPFMARGRAFWSETRSRITGLLADDAAAAHLHPLADVRLRLPFEVADYVDFYCSLEHATNLGRMFRPDEEPLKPNWRHLPVGYHGRAGTVFASGTEITRPHGQRVTPGVAAPEYGGSRKLDFEAEVGFVVGVPTEAGETVPPERFADHVFGVVLVNDWSARDVQAFEYVPLGPFLGKSFATTVGAWVTPLEALEAARVPGPRQDPEPLDYLRPKEPWGLDLTLEVHVNGTRVSEPPYAGMYWTPDQMLAHLTANGARLRTGDLFASGTVSGPAHGQRGSLIELSWNGAEPVVLADGTTRTFLEDGDTVVLTASATATDGGALTLAEAAGTVVAR
ncbi:fumarylacetoacetase [Actinocorallia sp. A-T 12471]|uniref:fumarylacetoacetase n=1 Tax=Actinocorallia sp. A-T 12471 TaxID=3089813 RepID=UPI0029D04036|nr:fumarylacetoacetase [Actinocorallia sp. A-T 12471]MDX6742389.1 fumarylacetoacetase [Actinocorallia sp. A-T 12471]